MSLIFRNNLNIILCGSIYTSQPVQISTSDCTAELSLASLPTVNLTLTHTQREQLNKSHQLWEITANARG
ncbi:hypothetical protein ABG768_025804, partial [Culter alburnus]